MSDDIQRAVGILATGFTTFTLILQGTTLRWVIGWLGLERLSSIDEVLSRQVVAVASQAGREDVARIIESYELSRDIVCAEATRFGERPEMTVKSAQDSGDILDGDPVTLDLLDLADHQRNTIIVRVRERTISARTVCTTVVDQITGYQMGVRDADAHNFHTQPTLLLMRPDT